MTVFRTLVGIFGILLAVFAGGCSLISLSDSATRQAFGFGSIIIFGILPMLIGILMAWWGLRKRPDDY